MTPILAKIATVAKDKAVQCQHDACGHRVYGQVHILVWPDGRVETWGSTCWAKYADGRPEVGPDPRYQAGRGSGEPLTDEERRLLEQNREELIALFKRQHEDWLAVRRRLVEDECSARRRPAGWVLIGNFREPLMDEEYERIRKLVRQEMVEAGQDPDMGEGRVIFRETAYNRWRQQRRA